MDKQLALNSQSLSLLKTPVVFNTLIKVAFFVLFLFIFVLFLPWRQTVTGVGSVIVFEPMNRPQSIQAQIPSKVKKWYVREGDFVQKGDLILELEELDIKYLDREQINKLISQRNAIKNKIQAIESLIETYKSQILSLNDLRDNIVPNAKLKINQNENKLIGLEKKVEGLKQNVITTEINIERRQKLFEKGLASQREFELAQLDLAKAQAEFNQAQAELDIFRQQIDISRFDLNKVSIENQLKVQDMQAKIAESYDKLAESNKELFKFDNEIENLQERIEQRYVRALVSGQVTGVKALGQAQTIKKDEVIATIIPQSDDIAAELYVSEFFAPLLSVGREVRVQFSGYPAIQFAGWPNIAVGTFAGKIAVVDAVNLKQGEFRIILKPDLERINSGKEQAWPSLSNLRVGSKAWGWIILDEVPVWYELWRVINGFPPSIMENKNKITEVPKIKA